MKLESRYILEWVAWHRLQGFDIMIADNCTEGRQTALLQRLTSAGLIHYVDVRDIGDRPQMPAYHIMFHNAVKLHYRYLGYLDADEFFEPLVGEKFGGAALIKRQLRKPFLCAVSFRWCSFGSSGQELWKDGLVLERFTAHAPSEHMWNQQVKSFARTSTVSIKSLLRSTGKAIPGHHVFKLYRCLYAFDGTRCVIRNDEGAAAAWNIARIRHYPIKSKEEFTTKQSMGDAYYGQAAKRGHSYFVAHDLNDVEEPLDQETLDRVKEEIAKIRALISEKN